jgi:hypothetical protein
MLNRYSGEETQAVILAKTDVGLDGQYWLAEDTGKVFKGKVVSGVLTWINVLSAKNQFAVKEDTIYEVKRWGSQFEKISFNLFVKGAGTIKIYSAEIEPADLTEMQLIEEDIIGLYSFMTIPNYVYFEIESGVIDEIIITGIEPVEV